MGGKSQIVTFYPTIGFQYTTFHKGIDLKIKVIQCNMVNEENLLSPKVIRFDEVNYSILPQKWAGWRAFGNITDQKI